MKKLIKKVFHPFTLIFIFIFIDHIFLNVVHPFLMDFVELLHCVGVIHIDEKMHSKLIFLVTPLANKIISIHKFDYQFKKKKKDQFITLCKNFGTSLHLLKIVSTNLNTQYPQTSKHSIHILRYRLKLDPTTKKLKLVNN